MANRDDRNRIEVKRGVVGPFKVPTGLENVLVVGVANAFVLDVEDDHFNFDRRVVLPDLASNDGSTPVLTKQRITGLGAVFAALVHARENPSQRLFVTGHTDRKGSAAYNRTLSENRAKSVSLLLRGKRKDWAEHAAKQDCVDDVQAVLQWQNQRDLSWECDPGGIDNDLGPKTKRAIVAFQRRYNEVVKANEGKDTPFKKKIASDGTVGKETWGAFYDVYMEELMDLLEIESYSELEKLQAGLQAPAGLPDFVGCGEHVPFDPALRTNAEPADGERSEGPERNPTDRRVEILFLDPGEKIDLKCEARPGNPGKCQPDSCPLYKQKAFEFEPIEVPKGLAIAEANLKLTFVDPEGKIRPFPDGLEVAVKFGDPKGAEVSDDDIGPPDPFVDFGADLTSAEPDSTASTSGPTNADPTAEPADDTPQEPTVQVGPGGLVRLVIPRRSSSFYLRFLTKGRSVITADPDNLADQKLVTPPEARVAVGQGRSYLQLPRELNTSDGYWTAPTVPEFKNGAFMDVDNRKTKIGSRASPAELRLDVRWQYFRFEYFDRWSNSVAAVPQARTTDAAAADAAVLTLEGRAELLDPASKEYKPHNARSAWTLGSGKDVVHCLGWVRRVKIGDGPPATPRDVPDAKCLVRFWTNPTAYVRTDGDGTAKDARNLVRFTGGSEPPVNAERLRYYDLPSEWWSTNYPVRMAGESVDKAKPFQNISPTASTKDKPYLVSLDLIVLAEDTANIPDSDIVWDDSAIQHRFAIFDNELRVYKPDEDSKETYFTSLNKLSRKPDGPVLYDYPPFTRLIARGRALYDVFNRRTRRNAMIAGFPIGARLASRFAVDKDQGCSTNKSAYPYIGRNANGSAGTYLSIPSSVMLLLRCCGHEGAIEKFVIFQYTTVFFFFPFVGDPAHKAIALDEPPTGSDAVERARDCILKLNARWNGEGEAEDKKATYHIGEPETAEGRHVVHIARGVLGGPNEALISVDIYKKIRAFMSAKDDDKAIGKWALHDMAPTSGGRFTAAHEMGHALSLPDEYLNNDYEPSLDMPHIAESARSPGSPYGFDHDGMMNGNKMVRTRYHWHPILWCREGAGPHFQDVDQIKFTHQGFVFTAKLTAWAQDRVTFPVSSDLNHPVAATGLCDRFVYLWAHDGYTAGVLKGSSAKDPFDGFVAVRVKLAWSFKTTTDYDSLSSLASRAMQVIHSVFNADKHLVMRGVVDGKPVRLRVLFAPRFVCRTFPEGDGATEYLQRLRPVPANKSAYNDGVKKLLTHGVHAEVAVVESGPSGVVAVSAGDTTPRTATARLDGTFLTIVTSPHFDDDVVRIFSQLLGLSTPPSAANDFAPLFVGLAPVSNVKLEYAP